MTEPYETAASNAYQWTNRAFDLLTEGKMTATVASASGVQTAVVRGTCPRCGHEFRFSQVLDAVAGESMAVGARPGGQRAVDDYVPLTVSCECDEEHAGRPDGLTHGCGVNFRVEVRRDGS